MGGAAAATDAAEARRVRERPAVTVRRLRDGLYPMEMALVRLSTRPVAAAGPGGVSSCSPDGGLREAFALKRDGEAGIADSAYTPVVGMKAEVAARPERRATRRARMNMFNYAGSWDST